MPAPPVELFRRLTNGVYVVTASHGDRTGAFTAAWITQVSFDPLLVTISINTANATWPLIQQSGRFAITVLSSDQRHLAGHFGLTSGRDVDKLSGLPTVTTTTGAIALAGAAAWLECTVEQRIPAGDHVVIIARAVAGDLIDGTARPLRYSETGDMDGSAALYPPAFPSDN